MQVRGYIYKIYAHTTSNTKSAQNSIMNIYIWLLVFHKQSRSIGEFGSISSDWSDPFFIPIEDGYTVEDCNFVASKTYTLTFQLYI